MNTIAFIHLILCSTVFVNASVDLKDFYPFGEQYGDTVLPRGENQCDSVIMKIPFHDGANVIYNELYISTNGVLSSNKSFCSYSKGDSPSSQFTFISNTGMIVMPFFTLTSTLVFGTVQFRETYDVVILSKINKDMSDLGFLSYNATNALIATWIDVTFAAYTGHVDSTPKNSFQAVVTSDGFYTFAIFYYNKITWNQGDYSSPCTGDTSTGIGINCLSLTGCVYNSNLECPTDCVPGSLFMSNNSNVNRPGVWITRVSMAEKKILSIQPAYLDMMGHRSLNVVIPDSINISTQLYYGSKRSNNVLHEGICDIISSSNDQTALSCYIPFCYSYGYLNIHIQNKFFSYGANKLNMFVMPAVPEVYIKVVNVSMIDYSVSIRLKWNAPLIAQLNPGCETVNVSMHLFVYYQRMWNESFLVMKNVNNSGELDFKLEEPISGLFLTRHLVLGVTGNTGPYATNKNAIFSKTFVFDLDSFNLKAKRSGDLFPVVTVDMMGHRKLNISFRTTPGQEGLCCGFSGVGLQNTKAIASSDNQYVTCPIPFFYNYGGFHCILFEDFTCQTNDIREFQSQQVGEDKKMSNKYKTMPKLTGSSRFFIIDVLTPFPRLVVEQLGIPTESNGQFQVQLQFTWDPSEIPSEYPVLNAFIYQFDDEQNHWMKELMVSPQDIQPSAGSVSVILSQDTITIFFNYKVMFGLGYVQGDENFVIFSKMYIPGVST